MDGARAQAAVGVGGHPAFDVYVRERSEGLVRLAWLITRDGDDARDAVQDALTALYPRWTRLPADERLEAYVSRSVVNACLSVLRRRRAVPVADPSRLADAPIGVDVSGRVVDADRVWRWCGELPAVQRAAVVLRFYRDLDYAGVAQVLGCREATARSHVHRAVAAMRARAKAEEDLADG
ncbi:MAG: sigma-70 family RNA polymerase sigma factor [Propionicimonas sp.]|uniref:sigma-70 family RNA polymerase sigma factor n=1 Tax=Propionicimonas sp. TaxID=1955623 RepID=UPI003D10985D